MSQIQKSISLDEHTWKLIDKLRIDLPRSRFVARIIARSFKDSEGSV